MQGSRGALLAAGSTAATPLFLLQRAKMQIESLILCQKRKSHPNRDGFFLCFDE